MNGKRLDLYIFDKLVTDWKCHAVSVGNAFKSLGTLFDKAGDEWQRQSHLTMSKHSVEMEGKKPPPALASNTFVLSVSSQYVCCVPYGDIHPIFTQ